MKRFLFLLIASAITLSTFAFNEQQLRLRSDIMNFLREEGFMPEIDDDGDIAFKRQGTKWYVIINPKDVNPMFLSMQIQFAYNDTYTKETVSAAIPELNKYKGIKVTAWSRSFSLAAEMYLINADVLRYSFYKLVSQIDDAEEELRTIVKSGGTAVAPVTVQSMDIANVESAGDIIDGYGAYIYNYRTKYLKGRLSVNVNTPGTYTFYVKFYNADGVLTTSGSSPTGYSFSNEVTLSSGSQTVYLSGWGSSTAGHWKAGKYRMEIYLNGSKVYEKPFQVY